MPLARKCIRCGRTFLAKKDEQYCKQCATDELMAILNKDKPPTPATKDEPPKKEWKEKVMAKCKNCGKMFEQTGKGRPAVNCPTCRAELNKPKKKVSTKDKQSENVVESAPVISKTETTESYIRVDAVKDLYADVVTSDKKPDCISNAIDHPSHYNRGKIEVIDFIEDQGLSFHLGNVIKYIARAGSKGDKLEDLKKARWYLDRYINEVMK